MALQYEESTLITRETIFLAYVKLRTPRAVWDGFKSVLKSTYVARYRIEQSQCQGFLANLSETKLGTNSRQSVGRN